MEAGVFFVCRCLSAICRSGHLGHGAGFPIIKIIEKTAFKGYPKAEIELLFARLDLVGYALFTAGVLILVSGLRERRREALATTGNSFERSAPRSGENVTFGQAGWMGAVQGLALPFRGFSRSGSTISTGLLAGANQERAERFSFALAVILTPAVIGVPVNLHDSVVFALIGMCASFFAGLAALRWLSSWLENGRWYLFGIYCIVASLVILFLHSSGY